MLVLLVALYFIRLTGPDDISIDVNPAQIVTVREPRGQDRIVHKDAKCLVFLADSKFIAVKETCDRVRELIEQAESED